MPFGLPLILSITLFFIFAKKNSCGCRMAQRVFRTLRFAERRVCVHGVGVRVRVRCVFHQRDSGALVRMLPNIIVVPMWLFLNGCHCWS